MSKQQHINDLAGGSPSEYLSKYDVSDLDVERGGLFLPKSTARTYTVGQYQQPYTRNVSGDGNSACYVFAEINDFGKNLIDTATSYVRVYNTNDDWHTIYHSDIPIPQSRYTNGFINKKFDRSKYYDTTACLSNDGTYLFIVNGGFVEEFNIFIPDSIDEYHVRVRAYKRTGSLDNQVWTHKKTTDITPNRSGWMPNVLLNAAYGTGPNGDVLSVGASLDQSGVADGTSNSVVFDSLKISYDQNNDISWVGQSATGGEVYTEGYRDHEAILGSNLHWTSSRGNFFGGGTHDLRFHGVYSINTSGSELPYLDFANNQICATYGSYVDDEGKLRSAYPAIMPQKTGGGSNIYSTKSFALNKGLFIGRFDYESGQYEEWILQVDTDTYLDVSALQIYPYDDDKKILLVGHGAWILLASNDNNVISGSNNYTVTHHNITKSSFGYPIIQHITNSGTVFCCADINRQYITSTITPDVDGDGDDLWRLDSGVDIEAQQYGVHQEVGIVRLP